MLKIRKTIYKNGEYKLGKVREIGETAEEWVPDEDDQEAGSAEAEDVNENKLSDEQMDASIFDHFSGGFFTGAQNNIDDLLKQYGG